MKIIRNGDSRVTKIINKEKLSNEVEYRLSLFTYLYSENGRYFIRSTLAFEVAELTETEWNAVQLVKAAPVSYDFIVENGLEQLALARYIVEINYDEIHHYQQTVFLIKTMARKKKGLATYTIFPTTGCNARCIYCYRRPPC